MSKTFCTSLYNKYIVYFYLNIICFFVVYATNFLFIYLLSSKLSNTEVLHS